MPISKARALIRAAAMASAMAATAGRVRKVGDLVDRAPAPAAQGRVAVDRVLVVALEVRVEVRAGINVDRADRPSAVALVGRVAHAVTTADRAAMIGISATSVLRRSSAVPW